MALADEREGFPRLRAVIQAMRIERPEQLKRERHDCVIGMADRVFGHNSRKLLGIIDAEAPEIKEQSDAFWRLS